MSHYLCVTVRSRPHEGEGEFKSRLSAFWTHMLRTYPDDFEKVYAETAEFERTGQQLSRQYLIEQEIADLLEKEFASKLVDHEPIDRDDHYSKYEASPPEWMWIEH